MLKAGVLKLLQNVKVDKATAWSRRHCSQSHAGDMGSGVAEWARASGVAEWARALTGDRTVNGSSHAAVKTFRFASELWQFRLPRLASVFRMRH